MPDESTAQIETGSEAAPAATSQADAAQTTAPETAPETRNADTRQAVADAAEDKWLAENGIAPTPPKTETATETPTPEGQEAGSEKQPEKQAETTQPALTDDDKSLLKRWQMDPADLEGLSPVAQQKLLRSLDQRTRFVDDMARQRNAGEKQPQADPQQAQQQQLQPVADEPWKKVAETWTDDATRDIRNAVDQTIVGRMTPVLTKLAEDFQSLTDINQMLLKRLEVSDQELAFSKLELPEGVSKDDPKVREQLLKEAFKDIDGGRYHLLENNWTHAIPKAAALLFTKQIHDAEQKRRREAQEKERKRSTEPTGRTARTQARLSEDELEDIAANAALNGAGVDGIRKAMAGAV